LNLPRDRRGQDAVLALPLSATHISAGALIVVFIISPRVGAIFPLTGVTAMAGPALLGQQSWEGCRTYQCERLQHRAGGGGGSCVYKFMGRTTDDNKILVDGTYTPALRRSTGRWQRSPNYNNENCAPVSGTSHSAHRQKWHTGLKLASSGPGSFSFGLRGRPPDSGLRRVARHPLNACRSRALTGYSKNLVKVHFQRVA